MSRTVGVGRVDDCAFVATLVAKSPSAVSVAERSAEFIRLGSRSQRGGPLRPRGQTPAVSDPRIRPQDPTPGSDPSRANSQGREDAAVKPSTLARARNIACRL